MTKDHSMIAAGKALGSMNMLFGNLKSVLPETGVEFDEFVDFAVERGGKTADAIRGLVQAYHIERLIKPCSLSAGAFWVRTDLSPPLPGAHSHQVDQVGAHANHLPINQQMKAESDNAKTEVVVDNNEGDLYVGDKPVELYRPSLYDTHTPLSLLILWSESFLHNQTSGLFLRISCLR